MRIVLVKPDNWKRFASRIPWREFPRAFFALSTACCGSESLFKLPGFRRLRIKGDVGEMPELAETHVSDAARPRDVAGCLGLGTVCATTKRCPDNQKESFHSIP